jgi:rod shape determining protein RodA
LKKCGKTIVISAIRGKHYFRDFDFLLAGLAILIVCFGTWQIHNAQPNANFWQKQLIGLGIALAGMLVVAFTDYRKLMHFAPGFYVFGLVLLLIVLIPGVGLKINGHRSWIGIPGLGQFQPSEFVKVTTAVMLARYFSKRRNSPLTLKEMVIGGSILLIPIGLIMLEPDAGSVLTYLPLLVVAIFLSAIRMRTVIVALVLGIVTIPGAYFAGVKAGAIKNYQQERINVILNPESADKRGFGYHTWESVVTIGAGGLIGDRNSKDFSQSSLKFLPESHTDFIFAVTSENTGFIGAFLLLAAYAVLLMRLIQDAKKAADRNGMMVIMCLVAGLACQIFINVGMALGMLPVIGVPLPLMSAGLASLVATFLGIGLAISVQLRRYVN